MASLLERMQRSRERWLDLQDGKALLLRRPTLTNLMQWGGADGEALVRQCLVGWRGFRDADLVPDGGSHECTFELDAAVEWLLDRPQLLGKVTEDLRARVLEFVETAESDRKN